MSKLFTLFNRSSDAAFAIDKHQRIIFWNETAVHLTGYTVETALEKKCWQLLQGQSKEGGSLCSANCPIILQAKAGKLINNVDMAIQGYSGATIPVNVSTLLVAPEQWNGHQPLLIHLMRPLPRPENQFGALRLYLLGSLRVQRLDGSFVCGDRWQAAETRALLVLLAQAQHAPISAPALAAALWPGLSDSGALAALATAVTHLRLSLEPPLNAPSDSTYIQQISGGYRINPAIPLWSDINHVVAQLDQARLEPNPQRAKAALEALLPLFRGDYLIDLRETAVWSTDHQRRAEKLHMDALEAAGDCCRQLGQPQEAKKLYLSALMLDPDRDTAYQKLLHLTLPQSDKVETLRSCQRLATGLRRELAVMLDEEFRDLLKAS